LAGISPEPRIPALASESTRAPTCRPRLPPAPRVVPGYGPTASAWGAGSGCQSTHWQAGRAPHTRGDSDSRAVADAGAARGAPRLLGAGSFATQPPAAGAEESRLAGFGVGPGGTGGMAAALFGEIGDRDRAFDFQVTRVIGPPARRRAARLGAYPNRDPPGCCRLCARLHISTAPVRVACTTVLRPHRVSPRPSPLVTRRASGSGPHSRRLGNRDLAQKTKSHRPAPPGRRHPPHGRGSGTAGTPGTPAQARPAHWQTAGDPAAPRRPLLPAASLRYVPGTDPQPSLPHSPALLPLQWLGINGKSSPS
jgi:hypothetical protein